MNLCLIKTLMIMKQLIKKWMFALALISFFLTGPLAAELMACCTGDYYICDSWEEDFISDVETNCDGCTTGEITWIDC